MVHDKLCAVNGALNTKIYRYTIIPIYRKIPKERNVRIQNFPLVVAIVLSLKSTPPMPAKQKKKNIKELNNKQ